MSRDAWRVLGAEIEACTRCPRLTRWCQQVAQEKRKSYAEEVYWGRAVAGFGDPQASIWIVGLAPGAHGANRTGRVFTGDRSGDFLYAGLHRAGLANQARSIDRGDGLRLQGVYISAAVRCAPPGNQPTPNEIRRCQPWMEREAALLSKVRVLLALGAIAWSSALALMASRGFESQKPKPKFAHGAQLRVGDRWLLGCYHVSQQNTFTGRLTPGMFDQVLQQALHCSREP